MRLLQPPHTRSCGQCGSVTVLVVFLLPVMCIMLMLVVNIGQAVFEKIRLQQTVDMCALSAANVQAMGLNEIADLNFESETQYRIMLTQHLIPFWSTFMDGKDCTDFFEDVFEEIRKQQDDANTDYAESALDVAQWIKKLNLPETSLKSVNPNDSKLMEYKEVKGYYGFMFLVDCPCKYCLGYPSFVWNGNMAGKPERWGPHWGKQSAGSKCAVVVPWFGSVEYKIEKKKSPTTYAAFKITQRPKNFMLAPGIFGKLDELMAYAAAKPVGGSIYRGSPRYKGALWQLKDLDPAPDVDDLNKYEH